MADRYTAYMPLSEIEPAVRNAKKHDASGIRGSIDRFGLIEQPVLDERTGRLLGGHGRIEDLLSRLAGGGQPPAGVALSDAGEWLIPVQRGWSSTDDREADAAAIALNRMTELGGWDERLLAEILDDLGSTQELVNNIGFSEADLVELEKTVGLLAERDAAFLEGLAIGQRQSPLKDGGSSLVGIDAVEFRIPFTKESRDEAVLLLRQHQRTLAKESLGDTLLEVLRTWKP